MHLAIMLLLLVICCLAAGADDTSGLGPIISPGITPLVNGDGVQAAGYHSARRAIPVLQGAAPWIWAAPSAGTTPSGATVTCFRGKIDLATPSKHVDAWMSADKHYRLWINGRLVSRGPADAGEDYRGGKNVGNSGVYFCDYRDITPYLHPGENLITAEIFTVTYSNWYGSSGHDGFFFKASAVSPNGDTHVYATDATWRCEPMAYFANEKQKTYVPANEPAGWRLSGFDDSKWLACAAIDGTPWPRLLTSELATPLEAVYPFSRFVDDSSNQADRPPVIDHASPYRFDHDGSFTIRCDRVISGYVTALIKGGTGAHITIHLCETHRPAGRSLTIQLVGGNTAVETPFYSSFAYVTVTAVGVTEPIVIDRLQAVFISDPVEYVGSFACSDEGLNNLWKASRWQTQMCMQDHWLDSPDHQEPICDFGDYLIESRVSDYAFFEHALLRQDMRKFGSLLEQNKYINFHTSYSLLWLQALVNYYDVTGEKAMVDELAPTVYALLEKFESWRGPNGLISNAPDYMFMDWVHINGIACHHPPAVIGQGYMTAFFYRALADGALVARLQGNAGQAAKYEALRQTVGEAFNRELWSPEKGLYRDGKPFQSSVKPSRWLPADTDIETFSAHVNTLAVLYGLAPVEKQRDIMSKVMSESPVNAEPYFYYFIFDALDKAGLFDSLAVGQMQRWKINPDSGTFNEMWNAGDLSHGWGSAPMIYMSSCILGVQPAAPGYAAVQIKPTLCNLTSATGVVPTPKGSVSVAWNVTATGLEVNLTTPNYVAITLELPGARFPKATAVIDGHTIVNDISQPIALPGGAHTVVVR